MLMNRLVGGEDEDVLSAALAIELLHTFTLVHDDIMDEAPLRRGKPSVWSTFGTDTAILAGDLTMVMAYKALATAPSDRLPVLMAIFNRAAQEVCEGQQMDMTFTSLPVIGMEAYLEMIGLKTAALIAGSAQLGVAVRPSPDDVMEQARLFGHELGMAFQIQDDILDVYGTTAELGKTVGGDLVMQKQSFLVVAAREAVSGASRNELDQLLSGNPSLEVIRARFGELDVKKRADAERDRYFDSAMAHLAAIPGSDAVRRELGDYCMRLVRRTA
jgi:geranylgeranyl diphosphate synthase type II